MHGMERIKFIWSSISKLRNGYILTFLSHYILLKSSHSVLFLQLSRLADHQTDENRRILGLQKSEGRQILVCFSSITTAIKET